MGCLPMGSLNYPFADSSVIDALVPEQLGKVAISLLPVGGSAIKLPDYSILSFERERERETRAVAMPSSEA